MSTTSTQPMSQLEAINLMLGAVFESPVNTLDASGTEDVAIAQRLLGATVRSACLRGVASNIDVNVTLTPDATSGQIPLPNNVLRVDAARSDGADVAQRGLYLYDRANQTFVFTRPVKADIYYLLSWDELPEYVKYASMVRAARRFQKHVLGDADKGGFDAEDALEAKAILEDSDSDVEDTNMLSDSWSVASILDRSPDYGVY